MPVEARRHGAGAAFTALAAMAALAGLTATPLPAQAQPRAEQLAACNACHGPGGNATVGQFPSIAGQPRLFIENQLVIMREGLRDVPAMKDVVAGLKDEEIVELARHYAAQTPARKPAAPDSARARRGAELSASNLCSSCHLPGYVGQNQVPRLAGQNEGYLVQSMKAFRDHPGPGRDTIMASTLRGMTDADLTALAHYLTHVTAP
jgi:cytochrome c553